MHHNMPFQRTKFKNFMGRGCSPIPIPCLTPHQPRSLRHIDPRSFGIRHLLNKKPCCYREAARCFVSVSTTRRAQSSMYSYNTVRVGYARCTNTRMTHSNSVLRLCVHTGL